jgi:hypothetical protein
MNYCLFVEKKSFDLIEITLNDYPIPGMNTVIIDDADDVLPPHLLITTEVYSDVKVQAEIKVFLKNIGYRGRFKLLKPMTRTQVLDDFELVPPY